MRVAVITANIGDFDPIIPVLQQEANGFECYSYYFTKDNLPCPFAELSNRMIAKYFKVQIHKLYPDYDIYLWRDARVRITSPHFVNNYIELLKTCDIVTASHPERKNAYEEFEYMIRYSEIKWMKDRFNPKDTEAQLSFIKKVGLPKEVPLFSAGISARWNNEKLNKMYDEWWDLILRYNSYDQVFYSYGIWKHGLTYKVIDYYNPFFKVEDHRQ